MEGSGLVQRNGDSDLVQAVEEVRYADPALGVPVPLVEDAVEVGARGVFPPKGASDVHHVLLVDGLLQGQRLVRKRFLPLADGFLHALGGELIHGLGEPSSFVRVGGQVA